MAQVFGQYRRMSSAAAMTPAASSPSRIAVRSRGPPRSSDKRESARSMSGVLRKESRKLSRRPACSSRKATASSRRVTVAWSRDGLEIRRSSSRAPPAVTVRSMVASSDPSRPPDRAWVSSRLRRVAASICIDRVGAFAHRRAQQRQAALLGDLEIVDDGAERASSGAAEGAEGIERADTVEVLQTCRGPGAVEGGAAERR